MIKKSGGLRKALGVEAAVNPTTLNNVLRVKVSLTVPDKVYFFAAQFSTILRRKIENYL